MFPSLKCLIVALQSKLTGLLVQDLLDEDQEESVLREVGSMPHLSKVIHVIFSLLNLICLILARGVLKATAAAQN